MWRHSSSTIRTGVQPTATALVQVNVFRPDVVRPSLSIEQALANAPEHKADGWFACRRLLIKISAVRGSSL